MKLLDSLETKDSRITSQFYRFAVVGGISTAINYAVFFALYALLSVDYVFASAIGYITGALFGYTFNARLTFRSEPGLSVISYMLVYTFSLVASLGVLKFAVLLGFSPLIANIIAIAFSTATNFAGCRWVVFNKNFHLPGFFRSRLFIAVLLLKIVFAFLFASDFMTQLFVPFVKYFVANPLSNPYQHFFDIGNVKAFPYPPLMLFITGIPYVLFGVFGGSAFFDIFAMRISLLLADIAILFFLCKILPLKQRSIMLLYWASPVVFYITYIHGQLDMIPVAFLVASLYFLRTKKYAVSAAFLGISLATKSFVLIAFPIYLIYLMRKKMRCAGVLFFFLISAAVYAAILLPYAASSGFIHMVFQAEEQSRIFNLSVDFTSGLAYFLVPAIYAYMLFKAAALKKITNDMLFVLIGITLTVLVTFINPERGWYLWAVPFIVYFFAKERISPWIYWAFSASYLLYFLFVPNSDVFEVFQVMFPEFATAQVPYAYVSSIIDPRLLVNIIFTALTSVLIYISYIIYRKGVKNSIIFQEKNGIPVIGIGGDSGSGKTTLASSLADLFGNDRVSIVYGDDIHKWERADVNWKKHTHLSPAGNKIYLNYSQIRQLKSGIAISRPHYDHGTGRFTKPVEIKPRDIIISEGLHTFFINESNSVYEIKAFMDPHPSLRILWKMRRDMKSRGYSKKDVIRKMKEREKDAEKFILPQKMHSDIIVSYMPEEKVDFSDVGRDVSLYLAVDIKNDIPIDGLMDAMIRSGLGVEMQYPDHRFQRIVLRGGASKADVEKILSLLDIDYDSYEINKGGIMEGFEGIIQIIFLYCLNERLKMMGGREDE